MNVEEIAIVGMACRFPGARNIQEFWKNLCVAKECIRVFSREELYDAGVDEALLNSPDYVLASPTLEQVDAFDAEFFEYSPREARFMDPQQRLMLEVVWEAIEDAGYPPDQFTVPVGTFMGSGGIVSSYLVERLQQHPDFLGTTGSLEHLGNDKDFLSTRIAYKLNLTGPSINVQTACSTSLVALHLACQSLQIEECELAVAGASTIRFPHHEGYLHKKGDILSPDGHCRPFDADAAGTLFGSGVAAVLLKPVSKALRDKDRIYAVIKASSINNDGAMKFSYTASSVPGQVRAMRSALTKAQVHPEQVGYIECHGTGTIVGDPLEIDALNQAFSVDTQKKKYCPIGSVKGNIGHLEQTAGLASLIKTALILYKKMIPASINYQSANPKIKFQNTPFYVNTQAQLWEDPSRIACINSLGLGGTNAFAVLANYPSKTEQIEIESKSLLVNLSAKNPTALFSLKHKYAHFLIDSTLILPELAYTASVGRTHFLSRASYLVDSLDQLKEKVDWDIQHEISAHNKEFDGSGIVFLFTGQGSQYFNMGKNLYDTELVFRSQIDECDRLLKVYREWSLLELLYQKDKSHLLDETLYTQPILFCIEYALAILWRSWGIEPHAVMGHSVGEYVAACIAGVFSLEDGLRLISERARLMDGLAKIGTMAVIFADERRVRELLQQQETSVAIAAINGPLNTVISGTKIAIEIVLQRCEKQHLTYERLKVSHAFHSPLLEPILSDLTAVAQTIPMKAPKIKWISNVTGALMQSVPTASYWADHACKPVDFQAGLLSLQQMGFQIYLELGPGNTLVQIGRTVLTNQKIQWLTTLHKKATDNNTLLQSLQALYLSGFSIHWQQIYCQKPKISLPTYPFQQKKYWFGGSTSKIKKTSDNTPGSISHPFISKICDSASSELIFETHFSLKRFPYLDDHRIFGLPVLPTTAIIELISAATERLLPQQAYVISQFLYERALIVSQENSTTVCTLQQDKGELQVTLMDEMQAVFLSAKVMLTSPEQKRHFALDQLKQTCPKELATDTFYTKLNHLGLNYGAAFRGIHKITLGEGAALAQVQLSPLVQDEVLNYLIHPAFLDACLHIYPALVSEYQDWDSVVLETKKDSVYLPIGMDSFYLWQSKPQVAWVYAKKLEMTNQGLLIIDVFILDEQGQLIVMMKHLTLRLLSIDDIKPVLYVDHLYQMSWQEQLPNPSLETQMPLSSWLIVGEPNQVTDALTIALTAQKHRVYQLIHGAFYEQREPCTWTINMQAPDDFLRFYQELGNQKKHPLKAIIYTLPLSFCTPLHSAAELIAAETLLCGAALNLVQSILATDWLPDSSKLWFVTQQAQFISPQDKDINCIQAELWGIARTIALECPNIWGGTVDLDTLETPEKLLFNVTQLLQELEHPSLEHQIVLRGQARFVPRLTKIQDYEERSEAFTIKDHACYLVTGGLGALGLCMAQWLVTQRKAKHLVLVGRNAPSANANLAIALLEAQGATVTIYRCDISVEKEINDLFTCKLNQLPPLKGIIHCAGSLDDGVISQLSLDQLIRVTRPKVVGGWLLHHYSKDLNLDFFILFSSILSLMGSSGQANYAAGNAFLDALGVYRRQQNLPALVMNWGPWAEVGLATHSGERGEVIWRKRGTEYIKPQHALNLLDQALRLNVNHAAVTVTYWPTFAEQFTDLPTLYHLLVPHSTSNKIKKRLEGMREEFLALQGQLSTAQLVGILSRLIVDLLGLDTEISLSKPLNELGLDSLIAVELINHIELIFGCRISAIEIIQGASLNNMTETVLIALGKKTNTSSASSVLVQLKEKWFVTFTENKDAKARLFCFPYAGGGPHVFKDWRFQSIEVHALYLPGRGQRMGETMPNNVKQLAEWIVPHLESYLDKPFAFFGHSMGGLLMYEVMLLLQKKRLPLPNCLFPSGVVAPHAYAITNYHELSDDDFLDFLMDLDFKNTRALIENEELRTRLIPIIRHDLALAAAYPTECSGQQTVAIPIRAFCGMDDGFAKEEGMRLWKNYTSKEFSLVRCEGNHYFIEEAKDRILKSVHGMLTK